MFHWHMANIRKLPPETPATPTAPVAPWRADELNGGRQWLKGMLQLVPRLVWREQHTTG